jgi:hypothetical protein
VTDSVEGCIPVLRMITSQIVILSLFYINPAVFCTADCHSEFRFYINPAVFCTADSSSAISRTLWGAWTSAARTKRSEARAHTPHRGACFYTSRAGGGGGRRCRGLSGQWSTPRRAPQTFSPEPRAESSDPLSAQLAPLWKLCQVWRGNKQYAHQLTRVLARLQPPFIFRSWDRSCSTICVDTRVRLHL